MPLSWDDLAGASLARQFPERTAQFPDDTADSLSPERVATLLGAIGPIQAQNARAPFIGLAARIPGVRHAQISAAYASRLIVRGSNLRGTVHTSTPADHALLDAVTHLGQRALQARTLRLVETDLAAVWAAQEAFAAQDPRTPAQLWEHLRDWISEHDPTATPRLNDAAGRYFGFGHGGLIREPLTGSWSGQTAPGYRSASAVLGTDYTAARTGFRNDPDATADALVRLHLARFGPASRHDVAWFSGLGLTAIDRALARAAGSLHQDIGPDERIYWSLPDAPPPRSVDGVRLLPEFDALLCSIDPPARRRFVAPEHYDILWRQENGMLLAPLMVDGRLTGYWRLAGAGRKRSVEVTYFARTRKPRRAEFDQPLAALATAMDLDIDGLTVARHTGT